MNHKFGIIFDCDGTLFDSLGQAFESFNYALEKIGEPPRRPEEIKKYFGASADRILGKMLGNAETAARAFAFYLEHQTELANVTCLHAGIQDLLNTLAADEIPLGIVTGRGARDLAALLKPQAGLAQRFKVLVADSDLPRSKPAPDGILKAAESMGILPGRAFYVGDSPMDMQAAHGAGCFSIAALWDRMATRAVLGAANPNFFATSPFQVHEIFQRVSASGTSAPAGGVS